MDEDAGLTIPPKIVEEVLKYAAGEGELTEDYYEWRGDDWIKLKKKPNMEQDLRATEGNETHTESRSGRFHTIPDFVEPICNDIEHTSLFKKMLADPLDKKAADEYAKTVNSKIEEEAKNQKFEGEDPVLPVSQVRDIVMSCAHLHHAISKVEAMPDKGAGLRDEDGKPLPDYNEVFSTWTNHFNEMMDNNGYPSTWKGYLSEVIPTLSSRRGVDEPFTREEIKEVSSQHGKSSTKCNMEELLKGREQASKALAVEGTARLENKKASQEDALALAAAKKPLASRSRAVTKSGSALQSSAGISKPTSNKRRAPKLLAGSSHTAGREVQRGGDQELPVDVHSSGDIDMGGTGASSLTETLAEDGRSDLGASNDTQMGDTDNDQRSQDHAVRDHQDTADETVFPADMAWYRSQWNEATPMMEQVLNKPRDALQGPGNKLATINTDIRTRAAHDQEQMNLSENPVTINADLEVPVVDFMRVMILCTDSLVASGKSKAIEIEESPAKTARELLLSRLERAGQPWHDSVDKLIECKAEAWKAHITAGTEPKNDELLWDDEFTKVVLESGQKAEQSLHTDVFADAKNQRGKIGGFRVASKRRDGTETYQVLVQKGTYNNGQTSFWHINAASMYRGGLVEEYKKNQGVQITSSSEAKDELTRLRAYKLEDVQISGIAVIPRTTGKDLMRMPTMFIQASVGDGEGPRFWSRSYMGKVWGQAATRTIRDLINDAGIPVLTNDPTKPNLFMPQNASKRTCKLWGVEYTGPAEIAEKRENITGESDGEREPNDGIYESDDGFVEADTETPINPNSKEFLKADKLRKMEELKVQLAELEQMVDDDE